MRALIVDPAAPGHIRLGETSDPTPRPDQLLIRVEAISLNRGELPAYSGAAAGSVPGWDAAGVVLRAAANGDGPAVGTRVVTLGGSGGWAALRAVDLENLTHLPDGVDSGDASALPVAAGTALRALRAAGSLLGWRVLVTGASGGVGRFAVQLAHLGGAEVVAVVGSEARGAGLAALGADSVVVGIDAVGGKVDVAIENAGGPTLVGAFALLKTGGKLYSIGGASLEPAVFPPYATVGPERQLISFTLGGAMADDLAYLVRLLAAGTLQVQVDWRGGWGRAAEAIHLLVGRKIAGKAVLLVE